MAPVTRRKQAAMDANSSGTEEPAQVATTTSKRGQKLALRSRDEDGKKSAKAAPKSNLTVFDEEDMSKPVVLEETVTKAAVPVEEEEQDESDDEAPEAVSTVRVASEIKSATKAAQRVAQD
ncbi:hypothetical protein NQ176_g10723 [Zarea fungicola]|uniref:Uncharacterized protein n=1 Tax=Zarea fungicola TaxID=93591 RepID=A0ACC1MFT9_9HYPO|nr:hypothetical protein NQ176_g10723 [Lecanicillium fungicola]